MLSTPTPWPNTPREWTLSRGFVRPLRGLPFTLEKSFRPRKTQKARKFSKRYQAVDRHPKGEWLNQRNVLICFVSFVLFVD